MISFAVRSTCCAFLQLYENSQDMQGRHLRNTKNLFASLVRMLRVISRNDSFFFCFPSSLTHTTTTSADTRITYKRYGYLSNALLCLNSAPARPLPDDKIIALSKLKAFASNNIIVGQMVQFLFDRIENIVGKGENAGYQHFLLFPQCFQKALSLGTSKVVIVR